MSEQKEGAVIFEAKETANPENVVAQATDPNTGIDRNTTDSANSNTANVKKATVCRFYARNGRCKFDARCQYSHDVDVSKQQVAADDVEIAKDTAQNSSGAASGQSKDGIAKRCRFYSQNKQCWRGKRCKFLHEKPENSVHNVTDQLGSLRVSENDRQQDQNGGDDMSHENAESEDHVDSQGETGATDPPTSSKRDSTGARKPRVCRFYIKGKCVKGSQCRFSHPLEVQTSVDSGAENRSQNTATRNQGQAVRQPVIPHKKVTDKIKISELTQEEQEAMKSREITQLRKRFPQHSETSPGHLRVTFVPSDPDWPYDLRQIQLDVVFPADYPKTMFDVHVIKDPAMPDIVHRYVDRCVKQWLVDKDAQLSKEGVAQLCFRPFLRWLDRNIEEIFTEGLRRRKKELFAEAVGIHVVVQKPVDHTEPSATQHDPSINGPEAGPPPGAVCNVAHSANPSSSDPATHPVASATESHATAVAAYVGDVKPHGTEVDLKGLQLLDAAASLMCTQFAISVQCTRCKHRSHIFTRDKRVTSTPCMKCGLAQSLRFSPSLLHPFSHVCGYLDLDGCVPFELLLPRCEFLITCLECNQSEKLTGLYYGAEKTNWCTHCHQKMRISMERVQFKHLQPGAPLTVSNKQETTAAAAKKPKKPADIPVKAGEPLPSNGTCKHYKKSYRWLRFPCCGKCYPCDVCHEENEDHEMKFASRMVCGYCAKEQPFANKPCTGCNSSVTRGSSSHWEGGKGCRDKIKMDRNDDKKFANQNKTQSRKSQQLQEQKKGSKNTKLRHN